MSRTNFSESLEQHPWLLADGATGTNLFQMGLMSGDAPELWNIDRPDNVRALHQGFADAGADIILTNSFGGNACRLKLHSAQDRVHELNVAAARLAGEVAESADRPVIVAGSIGPTGEIFAPVGDLSIDEGTAIFAEQANALKEGGADVLWIETISSQEELEAAVAGATSTGLPVSVTMSFDTNGCTMMGLTPREFARIATGLSSPPAAIGANCGTGAPELVAAILGITEAHPEAIVVAKGNCGIPAFVDGEICYSGTPELMADYARIAADAGARIIGGCCGTTNRHLEAMREALDTHTSGARPSIADIEARLGSVSARTKGGCGAAGCGARRQRRRRTQ